MELGVAFGRHPVQTAAERHRVGDPGPVPTMSEGTDVSR